MDGDESNESLRRKGWKKYLKCKYLREAFQSKKQQNLGIRHLGGGVVEKSKKSQVSVGNSSKLGGGSSEIKKVPSSRGYQRLKKNDSFPSYEDPKT